MVFCSDKLKLIITNQAKFDIRQITEYIAKNNKKSAQEIAIYFYEVCKKLAEFPQMGISRPDFTYKSYKFFTIKKHYIIVYKTDNQYIYIARFLTGWQDIYNLL